MFGVSLKRYTQTYPITKKMEFVTRTILDWEENACRSTSIAIQNQRFNSFSVLGPKLFNVRKKISKENWTNYYALFQMNH